MLRQAFGCSPSGLSLVAAEIDGEPAGMLVSTLTSVSLEPPLLSVCIQHGSRSWEVLRSGAHLGVSVLGDTHEGLCDQLAGPADGRFVDVDHLVSPQGAVLLHDASAWFTCVVHDEVEAGDHVIALLRVNELAARPHARPLVFHGSRYRRLVA